MFLSPPEFPGVPPTFLNVVKNGDLPVHADIHMQQNPERNMSVHRKGKRFIGNLDEHCTITFFKKVMVHLHSLPLSGTWQVLPDWWVLCIK